MALKDRILLNIAEARKNLDNPKNPGEIIGFKGKTDDEIYQIVFNEIATAIKLEIGNDPVGIGYAGLSFKEQLDLLLQSTNIIDKVENYSPSRLDFLKGSLKYNEESADSITQLSAAIANEINFDPENLGYKGLTIDEQYVLLEQRILGIIDASSIGPSRWSIVSVGIPFLPNDIDLGELMELLN